MGFFAWFVSKIQFNHKVELKTSLDHLPPSKATLILSAVDAVVKKVKPVMVILFGSHATGRWVDEHTYEDNILYHYRSDYDILVIVEELNSSVEEEVRQAIVKRIGSEKADDFSPIVHEIDLVNSKLSEGEFFFNDIQKEGIILYDSGTHSLAKRRMLTDSEKLTIAKDHFDFWFPMAKSMYNMVGTTLSSEPLTIVEARNSLFLLHQTTEKVFTAIILVYIGYKPKTHNLNRLKRNARRYVPLIDELFPKISDKSIKDYFKLLAQGYIDARYKPNFHVEIDDVKEIYNRVGRVLEEINKECKKYFE